MTSPNVLLIIMDSVRAKNTSLHGHRHDTTPFLSQFSSSIATQYEQARAPAHWSLPSHASIFTGKHVPEHGITSDKDQIKPNSTIFDELQEWGYKTGVFSSNPYLTSLETGLASGFDTVEGSVNEPLFNAINPDKYKGKFRDFLQDSVYSGRPLRSLANGVVSKLAWDYPRLVPIRLKRKLASGITPGSIYTDLFCNWAENESGPWAACINYMDAHHPYAPQPEYDMWDDGSVASVQESIGTMPLSFYTGENPWWKCEVLEHLYDGTIRQIDHEIKRLMTFLRERGVFDNTLVIISSDHGEGFGERSNIRKINLAGHNVGEDEVNLHVPLVVKRPGQQKSIKRNELVSLASIPAMIKNSVKQEAETYELEERPVVARTGNLREVQQKQLREQGVDLEPFQNQADVLYEKEDGTVTKWVEWNDRCTRVKCVDAQTTYKVSGRKFDRIEEVFDAFDDVGVKKESSSSTIDEGTKQRLEDLGYR